MPERPGKNRRMFLRLWLRSALGVAFASVIASPVLAQVSPGRRKGESAQSADIGIVRAGSQLPVTGAVANFTGVVTVDSRFQGSGQAMIGGAIVHFEPGARTAWHTHPLGQTLYVVQGVGLVQQDGGSAMEIRPGDIVWIPPGLKHWHGATSRTPMAHLGFSEALDGKSVDWLEKVSDAEYRN